MPWGRDRNSIFKGYTFASVALPLQFGKRFLSFLFPLLKDAGMSVPKRDERSPLYFFCR